MCSCVSARVCACVICVRAFGVCVFVCVCFVCDFACVCVFVCGSCVCVFVFLVRALYASFYVRVYIVCLCFVVCACV